MTFLVSVLLLIGCQISDNESTNRNFAQPRGAGICEELVDAYCDRCDKTTTWSYAECLERDEIDVDCDATINVGADHEDCMEDIIAGECGDPLPNACNGVVIVHH